MSTTGINSVIGVGGLVAVGPPVLTGMGPPSSTFKGQLGQAYFDKSTSPFVEYVYNGTSWELGGASGINEIDGNTGVAVGAAGAISLVGSAPLSFAASGSTVTGSITPGASLVATETGDTGTATPSSGNIKHAGTANQITTAASGAQVTYSLPSAITAPGSLTTTTTLSATTTVTGGTGVIATTGNIVATAGQVVAGADSAGIASTVSLTNSNSTTISTGAGSVKMSSGNPADNAAWLKIYIGTTAYWIPAWTTNAP